MAHRPRQSPRLRALAKDNTKADAKKNKPRKSLKKTSKKNKLTRARREALNKKIHKLGRSGRSPPNHVFKLGGPRSLPDRYAERVALWTKYFETSDE